MTTREYAINLALCLLALLCAFALFAGAEGEREVYSVQPIEWRD